MERRYSLPNCTLAIEGLSNAIGGSDLTGTPIVSTLVNAECHIQGHEQPLSGGREFLEGLARSVSQYVQSILSGIRAPIGSDSDVVQIAPVEGHLHRLSVAATDDSTTPLQVDLNTVELFDLVEAIDQLLADSNTLPELLVPLQPVSRQYSNTGIPLATRAAAPAMGLSSLAIAALVLALVPVPERVERPVDPILEELESVEGEGTSAAGTDAGSGADDPPGSDEEDAEARPRTDRNEIADDDADPVELSPSLETTEEITDPDRLDELNQTLYAEIDDAWENRSRVETDLTYRVSTSDDGTIIGYKAESSSAEYDDAEIPLPDLLYVPVDGGRAEAESLAEFKVVFRDNGNLEVSPWFGYPEPTRDLDADSERDESSRDEASIDDSDTIDRLWDDTQGFLYDEWEGRSNLSFEDELEYRVGVTEDGDITEVEPINQPAFDYIDETPLEELETARETLGDREDSEADLAFFKVVFTPRGVIEMSPWDGSN
ncbi:MAG: DUF4335 domain-containing protein [Cyanobacteriota bacterium]|nr:DUF4335 domain-containing protein [Cyanobacteriota bacterium]